MVRAVLLLFCLSMLYGDVNTQTKSRRTISLTIIKNLTAWVVSRISQKNTV